MKFVTLMSLFFLPFFVLADGDCHLVINGNGDYEIVCNGSGIFVEYITKTNELCNCSLENCEDLKNELLSACSTLSVYVDSLFDDLIQARVYTQQGIDYLSSYPDIFTNETVRVALGDFNLSKQMILDSLSYVNGIRSATGSLASTVNSIECGQCSSSGGGGGGGGGGCCDFTIILSKLNDIHRSIENIYDLIFYQFDFEGESVVEGSDYFYMVRNRLPFVSVVDGMAWIPTKYNFADYMSSLTWTVTDALPSLNNYFYHLTHDQIQPVLDILHHNSFMYYSPSDLASTNYYSYITNFYLRSAFGEFTSRDGELQGYTNWFDRVEALLAALVFSDSAPVTNIFSNVDSQQAQANQELLSVMSSVTDGFTERVKSIEDTSQGILESLRILRTGFSSFSQLPSSVTLAVIPDFTPSSPSRSVSNSALEISFQSSEMIYIINACRCATSLAWCIGGVWLLFIFVSWSYKQCYNLALFVWGVFTSIFKTSS